MEHPIGSGCCQESRRIICEHRRSPPRSRRLGAEQFSEATMTILNTFEDGADRGEAPAWAAVFALTLCVATLVASEFMPVSLLTPIAADLHITEGRAGQAIAVSGIFAVLASLLISPATRGVDRRTVLLSLTVLMM